MKRKNQKKSADALRPVRLFERGVDFLIESFLYYTVINARAARKWTTLYRALCSLSRQKQKSADIIRRPRPIDFQHLIIRRIKTGR